MTPKPPGLFVTGTDTNIGKTRIAALILRAVRGQGLRVGAYKPVCSGASTDAAGRLVWDDVEQLRTALGSDCSDDAISPQRFQAPLAAPLAARAEGRSVDANLLVSGLESWYGQADLLVVEGAGGLLAPVTETTDVADLAQSIGYPLVVVARCGLGTINHTLLTVEAARRRRLVVAGVVLNQSRLDDEIALAESNAAEIEARGKVSVLGILGHGSSDELHRHQCPVTIPWSDLAAR